MVERNLGLPAGAYAYDEEIQEQIEVVDDNDGGGGGVGGEPLDDELAHHQHHAYSNKFVSAEAPIDLHRLYDEMAKYKDGSNEELIVIISLWSWVMCRRVGEVVIPF